MTNPKLKNFRVESYQEDAGRCWGCCQENCGHCSCGCHSATETRYKIMRDNKVVADGLWTKPVIADYVERHLNLKVTKARFAQTRQELRDKIDKLNIEEAKTIQDIKDRRGW